MKLLKIIGALTVGLAVSAPVSAGGQQGHESQVLQTPGGVRFGILGATGRVPAPILFVLSSTLEVSLGDKAYVECGTILAKHGFLCVSVDLPCHGKERKTDDADGLDGWRARVQKGEALTTEFSARCSKVLDHLIEQGYADPQRVCACGTSRGGCMALHFAAADPRVKVVAAFAPVTNLLALHEFAGTNKHAATKALALANHADKLAGRPIWICIGNKDDRVGTDDVIAFRRRLTAATVAQGKAVPVELHVMPTVGHAIHARAHAEAAAWILASLPKRKPQIAEVLAIGNRLELFVDDRLIDRMQGANLVLHQPVPREIALKMDQPWERVWDELPDAERKKQIARGVWSGPTPIGFTSVMKDSDVYRLYYTWDRSDQPSMTGYAESRDGIHWTKPKLGIVDFRGSKANNLILSEHKMWAFAPFRDANPKAKPEERYKALAGGPPLVAFVSPDAIYWKKLRQEPVLTDGAFDSLNVAFWDTERKQYVAYYRDYYPSGVAAYEAANLDGVKFNRDIKRATSTDFVHWTKGEWLDYGGPREHLYTNGITPYFRAPHLYVGLPMRFLFNRKRIADHPYEGLSDAVFMSRRDGKHWDRRFMEAFIKHGSEPENWTERNPLPTWGVVPTGPAEMSMYWVEHFRHPTIRLRRGTLRTDGFVSLRAGAAGGHIVTKPLTFTGERLVLNYATSAAGSVRVEVLTPAGEPISGLSLEQAPELYGDSIAEEYRWKSKGALGKWAAKPVRLRLSLKDADVYSLRFTP
ncbi:MAG: hypothetical protein FJ271_10595 [Planctomycetes bacterium]|nr:hypothetical protein [Planctomycetota bacterium]